MMAAPLLAAYPCIATTTQHSAQNTQYSAPPMFQSHLPPVTPYRDGGDAEMERCYLAT
jgi:hypothetical protein